MTPNSQDTETPVLYAIRTTLMFLPCVPALVAAGWAAGRRGRDVIIVIDAGLSDYATKQAILTAFTDEEYEAYEASLPIAEKQRRLELTWEWRNLSRRRAMLAHLARYDEETYPAYVAALPEAEVVRRRNARECGRFPAQSPDEVLAALA